MSAEAGRTVTCRDCDAPIRTEVGIGWVDARSGDDGGTFDECPGREEYGMPHRPADPPPPVTWTWVSHDYEAGELTRPMLSDPRCAVCGEAKRSAAHR